MSSCELTVLIPTCDRHLTLRACLKTVVAQDCDSLEVLVSDNASGPETAEVVRSFDDKRIKMIRTPARLGMSEHWDFALAQSSGRWVTVLGDDDGLLPGAARRFLELANSNDFKGWTSLRCGYLWPGAYTRVGACVTWRHQSGRQQVEERVSKEWLTSVVRGLRGYGSLPFIYTGGFVMREVMDQIKEKTGRYFSSMIPDVYSGLAVASTIPSYGYSSIPFAIEGTSPASNGRQVFREDGRSDADPKLFKEGELKFHPMLGGGNVPSIQLMVYESYLRSAELRGYEVDTSLEEQLGLALVAPKRTYQDRVFSYCREVAEQNGLDFDPILRRNRRKAFKSRWMKKLGKVVPRIGSKSGIKEVRIRDEKFDDVYKASILLGEMESGG